MCIDFKNRTPDFWTLIHWRKKTMSVELIMSKWTGIELNRNESKFNIIDLNDKLPIRNFQVENFLLQCNPTISKAYPYLLAVMFGLPEKPIIAFTLSDHECIMRFSWMTLSLYVRMYIRHSVGLSRCRFEKFDYYVLELERPFFRFYMCCNSWSMKHTTKPQKKCTHIHTHEHLRTFENGCEKPSNHIFPMSQRHIFRCNCNIHLFC